MCICCCFCNCCNSYSSKCVEISILVLSGLTFISSILGFVFIKWSHLTTVGSILLILLIVFSTIITIGSICILIFRFKNIINNKKNFISTVFAILGLTLSIAILLISLVAESLVQTNFKDIDYPCKDMSYNSRKDEIVYFRYLSLDILTPEEKIEFCKNKNINYNAKICSNLEYTMTYLSATIIEFCTLILIFFWYNDLRRIKEKVDGELPIYESTYINRARLAAQGINFQDGDQMEPSDRYLNQNQLIQSNVVLVKQKDSQRLSQPIQLNNKKQSGHKNFIRDLRKEMQEAIESLDEESSENKENDEKKNEKDKKDKENLEDLLYSDKSSNGDKDKKKENKDINDNIDNNKNNDKNDKNIIFIDEENKDGTNDLNDLSKGVSIFKDDKILENENSIKNDKKPSPIEEKDDKKEEKSDINEQNK